MTITHIIKETGKELCFVLINDTKRIERHSIRDNVLFISFGDRYLEEKLPQGDWTLLDLTKEIKDEQLEGVMPLIKRVYGQSYYDYTVRFKVGYGYVGTATESLRSLMEFLEIDSTANWVLLVKDL